MTDNPFASIDSRLKSIEDALSSLASRVEPHKEQKFYTISETAERLRKAEITVYRNVQDGTIPSKKVGGRILIPSSFLEK